MKKFLSIILFLSICIFAYPRGGGGGGHASSGHASEVSEGHISESEEGHISEGEASEEHVSESETISHPYEEVTNISEQEYRSAVVNNQTVYFYLLLNHQTHRYDTIRADSKEDLNRKVKEKTKGDSEKTWAIILGGLLIAVIILSLLFKWKGI